MIPQPKLQDITRAQPDQRPTVLVVDDSRAQRRLLTTYLTKWGFEVLTAESGKEALEICDRDNPSMIVSDWMMPEMNGLDFCKAYRARNSDGYGYFILLTSKSEKGEIAQGLDVGADDFLTKPVNAAELRARIRAGERVLEMERALTEKNRMVTDALDQIQRLYDSIDKDLQEARNFQQSLVSERVQQFPGATVSLMLQPAHHVGGDLVGAFPVNERELGLYSIDVSGHGISSALMTARVAAYFSGTTPDQNIALTADQDGLPMMRPTDETVAQLNQLIMDDLETEHYLTIALARVNLLTGDVQMTQAGHPYPAVHRRCGRVDHVGEGGLPVGLMPGAEFENFSTQLRPGDRLFLCSDGITECADPKGNMIEEAGLTKLLQDNAALTGTAFFDALIWDLTEFSDATGFADDVSGVLLDFAGPG